MSILIGKNTFDGKIVRDIGIQAEIAAGTTVFTDAIINA